MYWTGLFDDYEPWRALTRLQKDVNQLFNDAGVKKGNTFPEMNVWAKDDSALITAELPGLDSKDINLTIQEQQLIIEGNRKAQELKQDECYHRQERGYGVFKRALQLPFPVNSEKIDAHFKNGVLSIKLPRAEEDKPRKIEIK